EIDCLHPRGTEEIADAARGLQRRPTHLSGREEAALTDTIASYGNDKYSQPEGAGAFHEDPVPWITDGGWTCVQDYGLGIFWEKGTNVVTNAFETGDP